MRRKLLLVLIFVLNEYFSEDCALQKRKIDVTESEIRTRRQVIEKQHYDDYRMNEAIYRNWPEVQQDPKFDCHRFLKKIFCNKEKINAVTAEIRNVILKYKHIRAENGNMLTTRRVTALECRYPMWDRRFMYFTRSPQSPKCAFFLNRIGRRSFNFYLIEDVCEHKIYTRFRNYVKELRESTPEENTIISKRHKRHMLLLSDEEIRVKRGEFELKHYKYCSINAETCKLWPELNEMPKYVCQKFLSRILPESHDLTLVTYTIYQVTLHYLEIKDDNNGKLDPVKVNAVECQFPHKVQSHRRVYFIRAHSYPDCVFYVIRNFLRTHNFYVAEELCDTLDHTTPLYSILFQQGSHFGRKIEAYKYETFEKLHMYEELHYQDYIKTKLVYEKWPELEEIKSKSYCQTLIYVMLSQLEETYETDKISAVVKFVKLKYAIINTVSNYKLPPVKVKALECLMSERPLPNRFRFIRTSNPHNCVYWIRHRSGENHFYFITREICNDMMPGFRST